MYCYSWPPDAYTDGGMSHWMSAWPKGSPNVKLTSDCRSVWPKGSPNVKLTWHSTAFDHQMLLLGVCLTECQPDPKAHQMLSWHLTAGQSDPKAHQMSSWPHIVLLLTTWFFYWGYVWLNVSLTQRLTKCQGGQM